MLNVAKSLCAHFNADDEKHISRKIASEYLSVDIYWTGIWMQQFCFCFHSSWADFLCKSDAYFAQIFEDWKSVGIWCDFISYTGVPDAAHTNTCTLTVLWDLRGWGGLSCTIQSWPSLHVAWSCTQFLKADSFPVLKWPAYSWSSFGMLCMGTYGSVVHFLPVFSNFSQPLKKCWPTFHRWQSTISSTQCEGEALHCLRQRVVTTLPPLPPRQWTPPILYSKSALFGCPFTRSNVRHSGAVFMLSNMRLIWHVCEGDWIISKNWPFVYIGKA